MIDELHQANGLTNLSTKATPWLCIAGAKGGVGKTMLASNISLLLARAGYRTLLVDFDPGTGNVGVQLRLHGEYDLDDVASHRCTVHEAIVQGPGRLQVLLGRSGPTELISSSAAHIAELLRTIRTASSDYDVVVLDTGAGLNPSTLAVALPHLVVNRTRSREEAMRTAAKLNAVTDKFLATKSELAGWISIDPQIETSIRNQRPLTLLGQCQGLEDLRSICSAALAALPPMKRRQEPRTDSVRKVRLRPAAPQA